MSWEFDCIYFNAAQGIRILDLVGGPPSVSDFALVRRQFYIFERAVAKFKSDVGLWVQYIHLAKREGAKGLASRICARSAWQAWSIV